MGYPKDNNFKKLLELHTDMLNVSNASDSDKADIAIKYGCPDYYTFITLNTICAEISNIRYNFNNRPSGKSISEYDIIKLSELIKRRDTLILEKKVEIDI